MGTPFVDAVAATRRTMADAGFEHAAVEVVLDVEDLVAAEREESFIRAVIDEAIHHRLPRRGGLRAVADVLGVRVYVRVPD